MPFHGLIVHFFSVLLDIQLSGCIKVCLSIRLLKDILEAFKFWQL